MTSGAALVVVECDRLDLWRLRWSSLGGRACKLSATSTRSITLLVLASPAVGKSRAGRRALRTSLSCKSFTLVPFNPRCDLNFRLVMCGGDSFGS